MRFALLLLSVALLCFSPAHGAELLRFAPQGKTTLVHQVSARFSEPMAALGDSDAAAPFEIDCRYPGRSQWLAPAIWTLEFERALPPGAHCSFRLKPGVRTLAGKLLAGRPAYIVETPGVTARWLNKTAVADEDQVFAIGFDTEVDPAAALAALRCQVGDDAPVPMQAVALGASGDDVKLHISEFTRE